MKRRFLHFLFFLWAFTGNANNKDVIAYEVLENGDSIYWKDGWVKTYGVGFLKDIPRYKHEMERQWKMDFNGDRLFLAPWYPALQYGEYVKQRYDVLTNFFVQLLTYEERQAIFGSNAVIWFRCAVDANGRVCLIPYFNISRNLVQAGYFKAERLYELACLVKNNAQFPLPPSSMTFGCMFLTCGLFRVNINYKSGVMYEHIIEYNH